VGSVVVDTASKHPPLRMYPSHPTTRTAHPRLKQHRPYDLEAEGGGQRHGLDALVARVPAVARAVPQRGSLLGPGVRGVGYDALAEVVAHVHLHGPEDAEECVARGVSKNVRVLSCKGFELL